MTKIKEQKELINALLDYLIDGNMSKRLIVWIGNDDQRRLFVTSLKQNDALVQRAVIDYDTDRLATQQAWNAIEARLVDNRRSLRRSPIRRWGRVVAIGAAAACIALALVLGIQSPSEPKFDAHLAIVGALPMNDILSIVTNDGIQRNLSEGYINIGNGERAVYRNDTLNYEGVESSGYNSVIVPKGKILNVVLSDGSLVTLNSSSMLSFSLTGREAQLSGEAFCNITHDEERPFVLNSPLGVSLRVLGTIFNVTSYPNEAATTVTLIEGSIELKGDRFSYTLVPSEQINYDHAINKMSVKNVDDHECDAWRRGELIFDDIELEKLIERLHSYYDFEVVYQNEAVKNLRFGLKLPRWDNMKPLLNFLQKTSSLRYTIDEKTIYLTTK